MFRIRDEIRPAVLRLQLRDIDLPPSGRCICRTSGLLPVGGCIPPRSVRGLRTGETGRRVYVFSYAPAEALHVSCEERRILTSCFDDLRRELRHGADRYTRAILTRHIIRLLDYTTRFYERQFITRNTANEALVWEYEAFADRYLTDGKWAIRGPLTAARCAERLRLSEAYFEDLLEQELGHTHHCHMQLRRIEIAKRKLRLSQEPLCQIVRELGFPSVQYFGFLFKENDRTFPGEYKKNKLS